MAKNLQDEWEKGTPVPLQEEWDKATPVDVPAEPAAAPPGRDVPKTESAARGAFQGLTAGWGDEASAALAALLPFLDREAANGGSFSDRYEAAKLFYRNLNREAQKANPDTYLGGQVVGAVAPALTGAGVAATGTRAVLQSAGQGAAAGAGYSEANDAQGLARDTALGGALGLGGFALGAGVNAGGKALARKAMDLASRARGKASAQALEEVQAQLATLAGQVGGETQKGSRYIENLMRLKASMTPDQLAAFAELEAAGVIPGLAQSVAQGTLESLPGQAATIASKRAALEAAKAGAEDAVSERTAQLLTPQKAADMRSFLKSYAEPLAWAYGGKKAAEALGADQDTQYGAAAVAGLLGGRTRGGKALMTRVERPAHQLQFAEALRVAAEKGSPLAQYLLRVAAPAAAMSVVAKDESQ